MFGLRYRSFFLSVFIHDGLLRAAVVAAEAGDAPVGEANSSVFQRDILHGAEPYAFPALHAGFRCRKVPRDQVPVCLVLFIECSSGLSCRGQMHLAPLHGGDQAVDLLFRAPQHQPVVKARRGKGQRVVFRHGDRIDGLKPLSILPRKLADEPLRAACHPAVAQNDRHPRRRGHPQEEIIGVHRQAEGIHRRNQNDLLELAPVARVIRQIENAPRQLFPDAFCKIQAVSRR